MKGWTEGLKDKRKNKKINERMDEWNGMEEVMNK